MACITLLHCLNFLELYWSGCSRARGSARLCGDNVTIVVVEIALRATAAAASCTMTDGLLTIAIAGGSAPVYAYMHSECPLNRRELGR